MLTPSAISHILQSPEIRQLGLAQLDGFIGPAHAFTAIGSRPYEYFAEEFQKPVVIAGFEALDVMQAILMLIRQLNAGRAEVGSGFARAASSHGNIRRKGW
ncbi:hydrogenase expression/formation protein HypD [Nitrosomonas sp. Nm51]|nr:hydrogenase expression/formation protein HypD [Nitrosomonas sp. Nm51]